MNPQEGGWLELLQELNGFQSCFHVPFMHYGVEELQEGGREARTTTQKDCFLTPESAVLCVCP